MGKFTRIVSGKLVSFEEAGATNLITVTAGENLTANDAVYISIGSADDGRTSGQAYKLDATNDNRIEFLGIVTATATAGNPVIIQVNGQIAGFTGLTAGKPIYASVTVPGSYQASAPTTSGQWMIQLGISSEITNLSINAAGSATAVKITSESEPIDLGEINYILNPAAAVDASSWNTYKDADQATPENGTGGTSSLGWSRTTTTPLRSTASFLLSKTGSISERGEGVSTDFTIARADRAKMLRIAFDYEVLSGVFATGDMAVWIYDTVNNTLTQPAAYLIEASGSGVVARANMTFQTAANSENYRLILHTASTTTQNYEIEFDNFIVGPQSITLGTTVTDWTSYTPTFLNATTLNATGKVDPQGRWRRVGDSLEVQIAFSNGSGGAASGTGDIALSIPSGFTIDTSKLTSEVAGYRADGSGTFSSSTSPGQGVVASGGYLRLLKESTNDYYKIADLSAAARWTVRAVLPIVGWSSSTVVSSSADTRVVAARLTTPTAGSFSAATTVSFAATPTIDTHGMYNGTNTLTCKVPGIYKVGTSMLTNAMTQGATGAFEIYYRVNSGGSVRIGWVSGNGAAGVNYYTSGTDTVRLNVGDTVDFRVTSSATATLNSGSVFLEMLQGPNQIAANEVIAWSGKHATSGSIGTSTTIIGFASEQIDTHNAYNTSNGVFTVPAPGIYKVSASIQFASASWTLASSYDLRVVIDGSSQIAVEGTVDRTATQEVGGLTITHLFQLNAGQTIEIASLQNETGAGRSLGSPAYNFASISRIGGV